MDRQNRPGGKYRSGVMMNKSEIRTDLKER